MKMIFVHAFMSFISALGVTYLFCKLMNIKIKINFKISLIW